MIIYFTAIILLMLICISITGLGVVICQAFDWFEKKKESDQSFEKVWNKANLKHLNELNPSITKSDFINFNKKIQLNPYAKEKSNVDTQEVKAPVSKPTPTTLAGKTFKEIFTHPISAVPIAGITVANAAMPLPLWANATLLGSAIIGEILYWRSQWTTLYEKHECEAEKNIDRITTIELEPRHSK